MDELPEGASLGVGRVEDFTWKGLLDFTTCTECGRCQSQCPAWNTEKPLSPKMLIMGLRDHANAKAPYLQALAKVGGDPEKLPQASRPRRHTRSPRPEGLSEEVRRGPTYRWWATPASDISPPTPRLVRCGHRQRRPLVVHHLRRLRGAVPGGHRARRPHRRHAALQEAHRVGVPRRARRAVQNLEGKGNPWGMGARARLDWAKDLPFPVKVLGQDVEKASDVDWLFWVGCAGAYEDRAKKTTRAVAELLDSAGVSFAVLGDGETCTGDAARRAGNELLYQTLAQQNVDTLGELGVTKVVVTLPTASTRSRTSTRSSVGLRGRAPHPAAQPARARQEARARRPPDGRAGHLLGQERGVHRIHRDLPRPVLPRSAQRRLRPAA